MKFSNVLTDMIDEAGNLSSYPPDDPIILEIQERAKLELSWMDEYDQIYRHEKAQKLLKNITKENMTVKMYFYLMNKGIKSEEIFKQLKVNVYHYMDWKRTNEIDVDHINIYSIVDTDTGKTIRTFHKSDKVAAYLGVPRSSVNNSTDYDRVLKGHYIVERDYALNPTFVEAKTFEYRDTYAYWDENVRDKTIVTRKRKRKKG